MSELKCVICDKVITDHNFNPYYCLDCLKNPNFMNIGDKEDTKPETNKRRVRLNTTLTGDFKLLVVEERYDPKSGERFLYEEDGSCWRQL